MKLKTELVSHCPLMCDFDALKHDVAAAHALIQAMNEQCNDCSSVLQERAAEIMGEWGFES